MTRELPSGWQNALWGELIELRYGKALAGPKLTDGPVKVFGTNGPTGAYTDMYQGSERGIVIGRKGAYRGVVWSPGPYWVIDTAFFVVPRPGIGLDMEWAFRALSNVDLNQMDTGSAIPSTSREDVYALPVRLPPLAEQRQIAGVLRALDDRIESNRRLANAADDVWIAKTSEGFADASRVKVSDLERQGALVVNDGYRAKNSELGDAGLPFVRAGNLTVNGLDLTRVDRAPQAVVDKAGNKISVEWDTAFTSKGTVGRITLVGPDSDAFVYSPQVCFWRSLDPRRVSPFVLHAWMRGPRFVAQVDAVKGQTDMADYVSLRDQRAMELELPGETTQAEITRFAEPLARFAGANRREAKTLAAIRDGLLPKLVTGQVRTHGVLPRDAGLLAGQQTAA